VSARILVVEDDTRTAAWLRLYLERDGFAVSHVPDGARGLEAVKAWPPDLVLLDLMLPGLDGFEVCRTMRESFDVPVILLTARASESDRLRGFDLGADDYVTKPFSPREVVARVHAVLRRAGGTDAAAAIVFGRLRLEAASLELLDTAAGGARTRLTPAECRILALLMRSPGRVFSRGELVERAFDADYEGSERTVDAHIKNLRRKLCAFAGGPAIDTVHGAGYRIVGHVDAS
jgi:DNA-binding response OmpR family regulator